MKAIQWILKFLWTIWKIKHFRRLANDWAGRTIIKSAHAGLTIAWCVTGRMILIIIRSEVDVFMAFTCHDNGIQLGEAWIHLFKLVCKRAKLTGTMKKEQAITTQVLWYELFPSDVILDTRLLLRDSVIIGSKMIPNNKVHQAAAFGDKVVREG